jgi:hypothetical protein
MKNYLTLLFLSSICVFSQAQKPNIKIDFNMEGRKETEVNEAGYLPWYIDRVHSASKTVSGITFSLVATAPGTNPTFRTSWSKALVQSPHYSRLVNDGVQVDNDVLLAHPGQGACMELYISGLAPGKHNIQTYHNIWSDTSKRHYCPLNIYLDDSLVHREVPRSIQAIHPTDATVLFTEINVKEAHQKVVLRFESVEDFISNEAKEQDLNVNLNAFELNSIDASLQAREPVPSDGDMHVNADSGFLDLQWRQALHGNIENHTLYVGTDSAGLAVIADTGSPLCLGVFPPEDTLYRVEDLYSMNTYYWRVDETDSTGETTPGKVWSFRPRHMAFRGAEGYGRFATGGRGGKVVEVTNLNDDGPGSFREAITRDLGPRTIVFAVSGIITLKSRLVIKSKNVTIAGQTAPGKGICIRGAPLGLGSESICRFIRVRLGAGATYDGLGMAGNNHSIIDHCSVSWTIDEAFSSRNGKNLTLQRTLISEALNIADHSNYPTGTAHGFAASIGGDVGSFHHNLLAHCNGRNWSLAGGLDGDGYYAGRLDIFNNVVYNWGTRTTDGGAHEVNFVNNYYKKGASSSQSFLLTAQLEGLGKGSQSYYYAGNLLQNTDGTFVCNGTSNSCGRKIERAPSQIVDWEVFVESPFFPSHARIETAREAYKSVLSDVGCSLPIMDDHDQRIIRETLTGSYTYRGSRSGLAGLIDHQEDAGGYEHYPEISRAGNFDSDKDGLPDWWEEIHGSNPNSSPGDFSDSNADPDRDGYTALEDYLEWMSVPRFYLQKGISDSIELSGYTAGYKNPAFSAEPLATYDIQFVGSVLIVTPGTNASGISYLPIRVEDEEGSAFTRIVGVCVGVDDQISTGFKRPDQELSPTSEISCKVYPSLFETRLNLEMSSLHRASVSAELFDLTGKAVYTQTFNLQPGTNTHPMECPASLPKQLYILRITDTLRGEILEQIRVVKI